jgi:hypothetical protein
MAIDADVILALNAAGPALPMDRARAQELAAEVTQLIAAADAARARIGFEADPYDFKATLLELAGERA